MSRASCSCAAGTTYLAKKPFAQWDGLMKSYYKKHEVKCKVSDPPLDVPLDLHAEKQFPTGSSYDGAIDVLGMGGYGEYTFPNGVLYRGQLQDGRFHGFGELVYKDGPEADSIIQGRWVKGVLTEQKILFNGKLEYEAHNWKYCLPDRRYAEEYETELRPGGQSLITPDDPPRPIPPGYYDTGDGFYNPKTKMVYDYVHKAEVKRSPSHRERLWILDNCRKEPIHELGPRPDLYENWVEPIVHPEPLPQPLVGYKWMEPKEMSTFEPETEEPEKPIFYDSRLVPMYALTKGAEAMDRNKSRNRNR